MAGRRRARRGPGARRNADRVIELKPTCGPPHGIFVRIVFGKGKVGYGGGRLGKGIAKPIGRGTAGDDHLPGSGIAPRGGVLRESQERVDCRLRDAIGLEGAIGRATVRTPDPKAELVFRLLLDKQKTTLKTNTYEN